METVILREQWRPTVIEYDITSGRVLGRMSKIDVPSYPTGIIEDRTLCDPIVLYVDSNSGGYVIQQRDIKVHEQDIDLLKYKTAIAGHCIRFAIRDERKAIQKTKFIRKDRWYFPNGGIVITPSSIIKQSMHDVLGIIYYILSESNAKEVVRKQWK